MNREFDNARTQILVGDKPEIHRVASLSTEAASREGLKSSVAIPQSPAQDVVESHTASSSFIIRPSLGMALQLGLMIASSIGLACFSSSSHLSLNLLAIGVMWGSLRLSSATARCWQFPLRPMLIRSQWGRYSTRLSSALSAVRSQCLAS